MSKEKLVSGFLVSKTDTKGRITYCNRAFIDISGFLEREVNVYVKNLAKDGGYYWVFANVTPSLDIFGNTVGYYSVRRKPRKEGLDAAAKLYQKIKEAESNGGIESGLKFFHKYFEDLGESYENFILRLQVGGKQ